MPKPLKQFTFPNTKPRMRYDWSQCAKGPVLFIRGTDYTSDVNMRSSAYVAARRLGMNGKVAVVDNGMVVQFFKPTNGDGKQ